MILYLKLVCNSQFSFNLLLDKIPYIYAFGNGGNGKLGINSFENINQPISLSFFSNIKINHISCGLSVSLALDIYGIVYQWGSYYYPYSLNEFTKTREFKRGNEAYPRMVESLMNEVIIKIGTGANHFLVINENGNIFTWGEGLDGQLGHGVLDNEYYPRQIKSENIEKIKFIDVMGGISHSIGVTKEGYVFGWGSNMKNQLNFYNKNKHFLTPILIPLYEQIGFYNPEDYNEISNSNKNSFANIEFTEVSSDINDLFRIRIITCGSWYTICVSEKSDYIFVFGNSIKRLLRIDYFHINKLKIDGLQSSSHEILIRSGINLYVIRFFDDKLNNNIKVSSPIKVQLPSNILYEKVFFGDDYLIIKDQINRLLLYSKSNRNFIYNDNKNEYQFINPTSYILTNEVKGSLKNVFFGKTHFFFTVNNEIIDELPSDIKLYPSFKENNHKSYKNLYTNTIFLKRIYTDDMIISFHQGNDEYIIPKINTYNRLLILISLLEESYIEKSRIFKKDKTDILYIQEYLIELNKELKDNTKSLYTLSLYNRLLELEIQKIDIMFSKLENKEGDNNEYIQKSLYDTYNNLIIGNINREINNNMKNLIREMNELGEEREDIGNNISENIDNDYINLNNDVVIKENIQKTIEIILSNNKTDYKDKRYEINNNINKIKCILVKDLEDYLIENPSFSRKIKIKYKNIQKNLPDILGNISILFKESSIPIQIPEYYFISEETFIKITELFSFQSITISLNELISILDIAEYLKIEKLIILIESILESLLSYENIRTLIQISKDYEMNNLKRKIILYISENFLEIKNSIDLRMLPFDYKQEVRLLLNKE